MKMLKEEWQTVGKFSFSEEEIASIHDEEIMRKWESFSEKKIAEVFNKLDELFDVISPSLSDKFFLIPAEILATLASCFGWACMSAYDLLLDLRELSGLPKNENKPQILWRISQCLDKFDDFSSFGQGSGYEKSELVDTFISARNDLREQLLINIEKLKEQESEETCDAIDVWATNEQSKMEEEEEED